ncbi:hypothetical protein OUZ56_005751 [Daphnia magna]|uniref:Uncharacterized protein n=1 Tax=Daphnia magna TaxID=35525 RepID=A0ABQ9YUB3_9CRUS|nr:hypothetical protein OUZ56_005751 [Daphnia magna]
MFKIDSKIFHFSDRHPSRQDGVRELCVEFDIQALETSAFLLLQQGNKEIIISGAKNRLLELLSSLKIYDPNWIDENLWKKYRDAIPIVPAVTWPKLIDYFQNEKSRNTGEPLQVQKEVIAAMEQNLDNQ